MHSFLVVKGMYGMRRSLRAVPFRSWSHLVPRPRDVASIADPRLIQTPTCEALPTDLMAEDKLKQKLDLS